MPILAIVVVAAAISVVVRVLIRRLEHRMAANFQESGTGQKRAHTPTGIVRSVILVILWITGGVMILEELGVPVAPLLATAGIAGIAIGFGAQTVVRDLPAGSFILLENQYDVGDTVHVANVSGRVEAVGLRTTVLRGADGTRHEILDLGCGWGSLTLWLAERCPASTVTAVSNSASQREYIERTAAERDLRKVRVITTDVNAFVPEPSFDRILSVEMLEHVRNHRALLGRIATWLRPDGRLFVHVFAQRTLAFRSDAQARSDWIGRHLFTGGTMPSDDLLPRVADELTLLDAWRVSGTHYARTARAWLANLDANRAAAHHVLAGHVGARRAGRQLRRWRLFSLSCEGLWGYDGGNQFIVSHYLFRRAGAPA